MLGDLFSKLDANDSTDTGFSFSVAHTSVERQSLVFLHTSPQKAVGTYIYIYIYMVARGAHPGVSSQTFTKSSR
jgi:hypothetical protein